MKPNNHILTQNFLAIPRSYFDTVFSSALATAQQHVTPTITTFLIANKSVRIISYGTASHDSWIKALAHHATTDRDPDLTIHALDTNAIGSVIAAPWETEQLDVNNQTYDPDLFGIYITGEESLNFYNPKTCTGYFWVHDGLRMPDWSLGAPFRTILHWFLHSQGIHFLHGAVVGHQGQGVLITAKSGSGKSTTSLACLIGGMDYVGDDYVAVTIDTNTTTHQVTAHNLYNSAKVTKSGLKLFPELAEQVWNTNSAETEKAVMFLNNRFGGQIKSSLPITAILIPRITHNVTTTITPTSKMDALIAVAPTTLLQLPLAETGKLATLKQVIEQVPCFYLNLGSGLEEVVGTIKSFLENQSFSQ